VFRGIVPRGLDGISPLFFGSRGQRTDPRVEDVEPKDEIPALRPCGRGIPRPSIDEGHCEGRVGAGAVCRGGGTALPSTEEGVVVLVQAGSARLQIDGWDGGTRPGRVRDSPQHAQAQSKEAWDGFVSALPLQERFPAKDTGGPPGETAFCRHENP
jgi:hypothetical protein